MKFTSLKPVYIAGVAIAFGLTVISAFTLFRHYFGFESTDPNHSTWLISSIIGWSIIAVIAYVFALKGNIIGLLAALFGTLVIGRINGLSGNAAANYFDVAATFIMLGVFLYLVFNDLGSSTKKMLPATLSMNKSEWIVTYFRLYLGYDFIGHFTEKWFAGPVPHNGLVDFFGNNLGLANPDFMVYTAGVCEFGVAIGLVFGLFTRVGSVGAIIYLFLSQYWGGHFPIGFIWALPGGGWEFGIFWLALIAPFVLYGAGKLSIENMLFKGKYNFFAKL